MNDANKQTTFLKWAGGKQWLAPRLGELFPKKFRRYFEPFLGGGSLYFSVRPIKAILGDANPRLIEMFLAVRDNPRSVIKQLQKWQYTKEDYYRIRSSVFDSRYVRAAQFIYLNRTCWNGLYRVNRRGDFNVPFGVFENPTICNELAILSASALLKKATINCADFENTVRRASKGDLVYFDPPYTVAHANNGFVKYNEKIFSWQDQQRLAKTATDLRKRGCHVLISNAMHPSICDLYKGFHLVSFPRKSLLAGDPTKRRDITEALFSSYALIRN